MFSRNKIRLLSDLPRGVIEQIMDFPMLLRHFLRSLWLNGGGMQILFTLRSIFLASILRTASRPRRNPLFARLAFSTALSKSNPKKLTVD